MINSQNIISWVGNFTLFKLLFKDGDFLLLNTLKDCDSILDLGCGDLSALKYSSAKIKVGVDINSPSLNAAKKNKTHTKYILADIGKVKFKEKSFDAVILIGVLEHLPKKDGKIILNKMHKWARKKIIVSYPNGWTPQDASSKNLYQKHVSKWSVEDLIPLGYQVRGITGAKALYKKEMEMEFDKNKDKYALRNIRFKPQWLFFVINAFLEIIVYYRPTYAATIFAVKKNT